MLPHLSAVTMLLVCSPSCPAGAAPVCWFWQLPYGGFGSPGTTGEVSAVWWIRQRRVAANAGLSRACSGTPTYRGSPT